MPENRQRLLIEIKEPKYTTSASTPKYPFSNTSLH